MACIQKLRCFHNLSSFLFGEFPLFLYFDLSLFIFFLPVIIPCLSRSLSVCILLYSLNFSLLFESICMCFIKNRTYIIYSLVYSMFSYTYVYKFPVRIPIILLNILNFYFNLVNIFSRNNLLADFI
jgi:hypothetical protein